MFSHRPSKLSVHKALAFESLLRFSMAPAPMDNDMEMSFGKHRGRLVSESWLQSLGQKFFFRV